MDRGIGTASIYFYPVEDIANLKTWGCKNTRYCIVTDNSSKFDTAAHYTEWIDSELVKLDAVLAACETDIKVLLNLHIAPGGYVSTTDPCHAVFTKRWAQTLLIDTWKKITTRYKGNTIISGFDVMNEPAISSKYYNNKLLDWPKLALRLAQEIYKIDPTRKTVLESYFGDGARLSTFEGVYSQLAKMPVQFSFHMYTPMNFTHQRTSSLYPKERMYPSRVRKFNKKWLKASMTAAKAFADKHRISLIVGEFSAARWALNHSAINYIRDLISIFEEWKWYWYYHCYRGAFCWSVEMGEDINSNEYSPTKTDRQLLLEDYFKL